MPPERAEMGKQLGKHDKCGWDGQEHPVCGVRKDCFDGEVCPHYRPAKGSLWRRKRDAAVYSVHSVDRRGVFGKALVIPAFCRMPISKWLQNFERVNP